MIVAGCAAHLDALPDHAARAALLKCCASRNWAEQMLRARPFGADAHLFETADRIWRSLSRNDWLEAFAGHPRIGDRAQASSPTAAWSRAEQSGVAHADPALTAALADANQQYERIFGYVFLICATGKSAAEMLAALQSRLANDPAAELRVAAEQQALITRIRLEKLVTNPSSSS